LKLPSRCLYGARKDFLRGLLGLLVHHALQDQNFPLTERLSPSNNGDRALAFRSVAEGDAVLTEFAYLFRDETKQSLIDVDQAVKVSSVELQSVLSGVPAAIADELRFQYEAGFSFVYRIFNEMGWHGINLLYSFPPISTEQVLHPEKFLDLPDPPTRVELNDLPVLFRSDWREIENNTLGELMVECLFKEFFSREEAKVVATGWDGDRFVAFRRGDSVAFIWFTVWDSPEDAEEFMQKYQQIRAKKHVPTQPSDSFVERRGPLVLVLEGLREAQVKQNIGRSGRE